MTDKGNPWYVQFFKSDYLATYRHVLSVAATAQETAFVEQFLGLASGDTILDLCCGIGRHSIPLAKRGFLVTGQDLNHEYLQQIQREANHEKVSVNVIEGDMRSIPFNNHFDAVINMFSSFGYLHSDTEELRVLSAIKAALRPGGKFLLDLLNREWVIRHYDQYDWREGEDGSLYLEHRDFDLATSLNHITFIIVDPNGNRRRAVGHHIRLYTLTEIKKLLELAGFDLIGVYGGFDGESYSIETRRMIVVAKIPESQHD